MMPQDDLMQRWQRLWLQVDPHKVCYDVEEEYVGDLQPEENLIRLGLTWGSHRILVCLQPTVTK